MRRPWGMWIALTAVLIATAPHQAPAEEQVVTLSIDEFTARGIEKGIQGRQNALNFESAGYSREIVFRQTDSPTLAANASVERAETKANGAIATTDSHTEGITLNELMPTGTQITANGQLAGSEVRGLGSESTSKSVSANLTQPIYLFVKNSVRRTRLQADLAFANARDGFDSTVLSLRTQSRSFYYQVMLGDELIKVEQRKLASSQKLLEITQAMVQGGKTAPVETMRAKIRLQDDERQLQNAIVNRATSVLSAKNFLYLPLDVDVHFSSQLEFRPLNTGLERLVQYAMVHNPLLRSLRRNQQLAQLDLETVRERTRPTLELETGYAGTDSLGGWSRAWTLGGSANWLFFDSFVTRDNVSKARIDIIIAELNTAEAERTTQLNINNAYLNLKNAERQIQEFSRSIEQARHNVEVVRLRFKNGLERLIDVFDAENDMRNLDNEYLGLLVNFNQQKDILSQLVGKNVENIR